MTFDCGEGVDAIPCWGICARQDQAQLLNQQSEKLQNLLELYEVRVNKALTPKQVERRTNRFDQRITRQEMYHYFEGRKMIDNQRNERRDLFGRDPVYDMECAMADSAEYMAGGKAQTYFNPKNLLSDLKKCTEQLAKYGLEHTPLEELDVYQALMGGLQGSNLKKSKSRSKSKKSRSKGKKGKRMLFSDFLQ